MLLLKFYKDTRKRHFLFGKNLGRFGARMTVVLFTDPSALEHYCKISNDIKGQEELSYIFIIFYNSEIWRSK